jgi:hypothetical protein
MLSFVFFVLTTKLAFGSVYYSTLGDHRSCSSYCSAIGDLCSVITSTKECETASQTICENKALTSGVGFQSCSGCYVNCFNRQYIYHSDSKTSCSALDCEMYETHPYSVICACSTKSMASSNSINSSGLPVWEVIAISVGAFFFCVISISILLYFYLLKTR